jgi:hypothetical protein
MEKDTLKKDRTDDRTNHKRERSGICEVTQTRYHQGKHELSHSKLQKVKLHSAPNLLMWFCDQEKPAF